MKQEDQAREVLAVEMERQRDASPTANEWAFILRHVPTLSENGAVLAAIRAMHAFAEPARKMLLDLLCVIHRDGGQHVDAVGLEQAWRDAVELSSERLAFATPSPVIETEGSTADQSLAREMGHEGSALELAVIGKIEAMTADRINHWFSRSRGAVATPDTALAHQVHVALVALKAIVIVAVRRALAERSTDREAVTDEAKGELARQAVDKMLKQFVIHGPVTRSDLEVAASYGVAEALALRPVGAENVRERALEEAAKVAECAFDDRSRSRVGHPSQMDWEDGVRDGTRSAATAIRALITPTAGNGEAQG